MKHKKSVTICCNSFPPEKGGAPTRIYNMALVLRDAGYEVTVISAMPNYPTGHIFPGYRGRLIHKEMVDGLKVVRLWLIPSNSGSLLFRGLSAITHLLSILFLSGPALIFRKTDLVIVSSPPLFSAFLSAFLARLGGKKVLVNISDIWPLTVAEMGALNKGFTFRLLQWLERGLYKMGTAFAGQSEEILTHIRAAINSEKPLFLYRNLQQQKRLVRHPRQGLKIIYAGNLGHAQGMLELCRNINFNAVGAELHIYGDGGERNNLSAFLSLHPDRGIHLHQSVSQTELDARLSDYDVMLVPLKMPIYGAVPSKLFMAIAAGLPVLFIAGGEGAGLVGKYELGWVMKPGDYAALENTIRQIAQLPVESMQAFSTNIQRAQEGLFSKEVQDKQFVQFIRTTING